MTSYLARSAAKTALGSALGEVQHHVNGGKKPSEIPDSSPSWVKCGPQVGERLTRKRNRE
jgi:hypothetical protein